MTEYQEAVAAGPHGLFYFKLVRDHPAKPWSEARPLPQAERLTNVSVSGITICLQFP